MRIAMVSEHASPLAALGEVDAGGQNVHVAALSEALARRGHRVEVYTRRDSPDLPERVTMCPGVEVVHVPAGPWVPLPKDELAPHMPAFGRWLSRTWSDTRAPDVVHAHFWMSGTAALPAARAVGAPVVQTFHALGVVKRRHQGIHDTSPAERISTETELARRVDLVVATCTDEVRELTALGAPAEHLYVVPCGVDTTRFTPWGTSERPAVARLLSVGRMVARKGFDIAVRAMATLPDAELVVVGGPPVGRLVDDPESRRLLGVVDQAGVGDRVRLLGQVPHDRLPALLRSADLVLATPWYEPFGIVPLEAMACGRPVVGTAVGGLLDTVLDGRTGRLVPGRDPQAVAAVTRTLLADTALRRRMSAAARRRAVSCYDWARVATETEHAYRAVVRRRTSHTVEAL